MSASVAAECVVGSTGASAGGTSSSSTAPYPQFSRAFMVLAFQQVEQASRTLSLLQLRMHAFEFRLSHLRRFMDNLTARLREHPAAAGQPVQSLGGQDIGTLDVLEERLFRVLRSIHTERSEQIANLQRATHALQRQISQGRGVVPSPAQSKNTGAGANRSSGGAESSTARSSPDGAFVQWPQAAYSSSDGNTSQGASAMHAAAFDSERMPPPTVPDTQLRQTRMPMPVGQVLVPGLQPPPGAVGPKAALLSPAPSPPPPRQKAAPPGRQSGAAAAATPVLQPWSPIARPDARPPGREPLGSLAPEEPPPPSRLWRQPQAWPHLGHMRLQ